MNRHAVLKCTLRFYWDMDSKLWRIQWRDAEQRPMSGVMKIDSEAPLDAWARRQIAIKVGEHFYSDLAGMWRD